MDRMKELNKILDTLGVQETATEEQKKAVIAVLDDIYTDSYSEGYEQAEHDSEESQ